jgi:hypothetical protein
MEWRVETDVPSAELDVSATAVVVSAFGSGPNYHFTITDERVRVVRSNFLPIVYVDIEPGILHTYRLELYGSESYTWSIDGQVIDSGIPQGSFLESDPTLIWGVRRFEFDHTTRWDYIRYGAVPEPATGVFLLAASIALIHRRRSL